MFESSGAGASQVRHKKFVLVGCGGDRSAAVPA
jgi:hypothetical protein